MRCSQYSRRRRLGNAAAWRQILLVTRKLPHTMVMSEHELHTWAVSSTSQRHPNTYFPGGVSSGILRTSTTLIAKGLSPEQRSVLPSILTESHGGSNSHWPSL